MYSHILCPKTSQGHRVDMSVFENSISRLCIHVCTVFNKIYVFHDIVSDLLRYYDSIYDTINWKYSMLRCIR